MYTIRITNNWGLVLALVSDDLQDAIAQASLYPSPFYSVRIYDSVRTVYQR